MSLLPLIRCFVEECSQSCFFLCCGCRRFRFLWGEINHARVSLSSVNKIKHTHLFAVLFIQSKGHVSPRCPSWSHSKPSPLVDQFIPRALFDSLVDDIVFATDRGRGSSNVPSSCPCAILCPWIRGNSPDNDRC